MSRILLGLSSILPSLSIIRRESDVSQLLPTHDGHLEQVKSHLMLPFDARVAGSIS